MIGFIERFLFFDCKFLLFLGFKITFCLILYGFGVLDIKDIFVIIVGVKLFKESRSSFEKLVKGF